MIIKKILGYIKNAIQSDFIRVSSINSVSLLIRTLASFISIKLIAVLIGPPGLALLGQLNNFSSFIVAFSSPGISSGITKFVVEHKESKEDLRQYISTGVMIILLLSGIIGLGLVAFSKPLSHFVFYTDSYHYVLVIFGAALFFYNLNTFLLGIINGFQEFKSYVRISIASTLLGLFLTILLVYFFKAAGALVSVVLVQSTIVFITLIMVRKKRWLKLEYFTGGYNKTIGKSYLDYILMALISGGIGPISLFLVRTIVIKNLGLEAAGIWDAMYRLSFSLLSILVVSLGVYYFPKAAEIKNKSLLHKFIWTHIKIIIPIAIVGYAILFFLKPFIIQILFDKKFIAMNALFLMQFVGDLFKISVWFYAYAMSAQMLTRYFIINEIFGGIMFPVLTFFLIGHMGLTSTVTAYALSNILSLLFLIYVFRYRVK